MLDSKRRSRIVVLLARLLLLLLLLSISCSAEKVYYLEVSESAAPGTRIGFINVDVNKPYLIVPVSGSAIDSDFSIDHVTGEIKSKAWLDRESRPLYSLLVLPQNVRVVIKILDENDNAPQFPVERVDIEFPENLPRGSKRALPPAKDPDLDRYSTQRYDIIAGNHGDSFKLVAHRGYDGILYLDLQNSVALDHEQRSSYQLLIKAFDGGSPPLSSQLQVNVTVQDVNDNAPVFEKNAYVVELYENATLGTPILQLQARDADSGDNGRVVYSINRRQSDREKIFEIDEATGLVSLGKPLDFETKERHEIVVVARDLGAQPLEASTFVTIFVVDVNDNEPVINVHFLSDDASPKVSENAPPGELVARISISDPDSQHEYLNATVNLTGGENHFGLVTHENTLYLVVEDQLLDREAKSRYELVVEAIDSGQPPLKASKSFQLLVSDENDNAPEFDRLVYECDLLASAETGSPLVSVQARDPDEELNGQVRYSILGNSSWFEINEETGLITTKSPIDCNVDATPVLVVEARDLGEPSLASTATVRVSIRDSDNNEPVFDKPFYNVSLPEDFPIGNCFFKMTAVDYDCGINSMINYTIFKSTSSENLFVVDPLSGDVCLKNNLDREKSEVEEILIAAVDKGGLSAYSLVRINIIDVNNNHPTFLRSEYNVTIEINSSNALNNQKQQRSAIVRCSAHDADAGYFGRVQYYFLNSQGGQEVFRIDKDTGEIFLDRPDLVNNHVVYQFHVVAIDYGGLKSKNEAVVRITAVLKNSSFVRCSWPRRIMEAREDLPIDSEIGFVEVAATSGGSSGSNSFFLQPRDNADWLLDSSTGALRTKRPLDRESRDHYLLSVRLNDTISVGYCQIEVRVIDVNDNPPEFQLTQARISVPESYAPHSTLYIASARDRDVVPSGNPLRYSIKGKEEPQLFGCDAESGEIFLIARLDYERQQRHRLVVVAQDGDGLQSKFELDVEVQDVNDNSPIFEQDRIFLTIKENYHSPYPIFKLQASDNDSGRNARLRYQILDDDDDSGPLDINPDTGWLTLNRGFDREANDSHVFRIQASDCGLFPLAATVELRIQVLDENDNPPRFARDSYSYEIAENAEADVYLQDLVAHDADRADNSRLEYSLSPRDDHAKIEPRTGKITIRASQLDRETTELYRYVVEAHDHGSPRLVARVPLEIRVLDANDNSPIFLTRKDLAVHAREYQPVNTFVVQMQAVDYDAGDNARIAYSIKPENKTRSHEMFSIDESSGVIRLKEVLVQEECDSYDVLVAATDLGNPPRQSVDSLRVRVISLTDQQRISSNYVLRFEVHEDIDVGEQIGSLPRIFGAGHRVNYTILSVTPADSSTLFEVESPSGKIIVTDSLDYEKVLEYNLEIEALDLTATGGGVSVLFSVTCVVLDVDDNAPAWPEDPVFIEMSECAALGSRIHQFRATDADNDGDVDLRYSMSNEHPPGSADLFHLDAITGVLSLKKRLDHETVSEYFFRVKAETGSRSSWCSVRIGLLDENDNDPRFVVPRNGEAPLLVPVNAKKGSQIQRIIAVDDDSGENGRVTYHLKREQNYVSLNETTGSLSLLRSLPDSGLEIDVVASDQGSPTSRSTSMRLRLISNGQAQKISSSQIFYSQPSARVSESTRVGTRIADLEQFTLSYFENVTFSVPEQQRQYSAEFEVLSDGGVVLRAGLDRERVASYSVPVLARSKRQVDATTLRVVVLDENDNRPSFAAESCAGNHLVVPENSGEGAPMAVHRVTAHDPDEAENATIVYAIHAGDDDNEFELDETSGLLKASNLDREKTARYVLIIKASDQGTPSLESYCNLTVTVLDDNDNAPLFIENEYTVERNDDVFDDDGGGECSRNKATSSTSCNATRSYEAHVTENLPIGTSVMKLTAVDPDHGVNGKVIYSMSDETFYEFNIDNLTGVISTSGPIDYEKRKHYSFKVLATDSGRSTVRSTFCRVDIYVKDVNDNRPVFNEYLYQIDLPADTPANQEVLRVEARDADDELNGQIVYGIVHDHGDAKKFIINERSGSISATQSLRENETRLYRLKVVAADRGTPSLRTQALVEFRLLGSGATATDHPHANAAALQFQSSVYTIEIRENLPARTEILQVTALRYNGRKQQVSYYIGAGDDEGRFEVDRQSGMIRVRDPGQLDYELWKGRSINLTLLAKTPDDGPLVREAYAKLNVFLKDANDNAPIFTQSEFFATVAEGKPKNFFVAKLLAIDEDEKSNGQVTYNIVDGNVDNAFVVQSSGVGVVRTNIVLDREIRERYSLTLIATDSGSPQRTGSATLNIRVMDVNDNRPTFPEYQTILVREDAAPGAILATVTANDVDSSSLLTYELSNVPTSSSFSIDRYGGRIFIVEPLDAEAQSEYGLRVTSSDGEHKVAIDLKVVVVDVNDNPPRFKQLIYLATLSQHQKLHTITDIEASDNDSSNRNNVIAYDLLQPVERFAINPYNGTISFENSLLGSGSTSSNNDEIELTVIARDNGNPQLSGLATLLVRLQGGDAHLVNQNVKVSLKENATLGTSLYRFHHGNGTYEQQQQQLYQTISGNGSKFFQVSGDSVVLVEKLDREKYERLFVNLKNGLDSASESSINIHVQVQDVNDNRPIFKSNETYLTIKEDIPIGNTLATLEVRDDDVDLAGEVGFELMSASDANLFRVNESTGSVTITRSPDCDIAAGGSAEAQYLVALACDKDPRASLCSLARLQILLINVNDNLPRFASSTYRRVVYENEPLALIARAVDLDGPGAHGQFTYSIAPAAAAAAAEQQADIFSSGSDGDTDERYFRIDPSTGLVTSSESFDYERRKSYRFAIRATDRDNNYAEAQVQLEIGSRDEFHPQFSERVYRFRVVNAAQIRKEKIVGYVMAQDADAGPDGNTTYHLVTRHPLFRVDPTSGALIFKPNRTLLAALLSQSTGKLKLLVRADSGEVNSLGNLTLVEIVYATTSSVAGAGSGSGSSKSSDSIHGLTGYDDVINETAQPGNEKLVVWIGVTLLMLVAGFLGVLSYRHFYGQQRGKRSPGGGIPGGPSLKVETNIAVQAAAAAAASSGNFAKSSAYPFANLAAAPSVSSSKRQLAASEVNYATAETVSQITNAYHQSQTSDFNNILSNYAEYSQPEEIFLSELSLSNQSGSSGHGSGEDDNAEEDLDDEDLDDDEEIVMYNKSEILVDDLSNASIQNIQDYLARLGIVEAALAPGSKQGSNNGGEHGHQGAEANMDDDDDDDDMSDKYSSVYECRRKIDALQANIGGVQQQLQQLSEQSPSAPELAGSFEEQSSVFYDWNCLLDWSPEYQSMAHVFSEIARLKDDTQNLNAFLQQQQLSEQAEAKLKSLLVHVSSGAAASSSSSATIKSHNLPMNSGSGTGRIVPKSPIDYDVSDFPSMALSPSFSPAMTPLASRSLDVNPSILPVPHKTNQYSGASS
ncbi:hypothetical protein TKK_0002722 [Trichogramma kaykai]|uniref:Protocadherin-16 n=1 Tax=Trichogramma kaykai TaxID=54128 RepID=A0ABD2XU03_9HYME